MITNDIQELLEGALGDEPMAELLHTLSVSPESELCQHIALHGTMQRDRAASALSAAEDAALWNAIATGAQVPAEVPSGGMALRVPSWLMRAAAVIVVGVGGYLLGSNQSTHVFGGSLLHSRRLLGMQRRWQTRRRCRRLGGKGRKGQRGRRGQREQGRAAALRVLTVEKRPEQATCSAYFFDSE